MKKGKLIVIDGTDGSGKATQVGLLTKKLKKEGYRIKKVNVDKDFELATKYDVMSIPTMIVTQNGKEIKRFMGVQSKEVLVEAMRD